MNQKHPGCGGDGEAFQNEVSGTCYGYAGRKMDRDGPYQVLNELVNGPKQVRLHSIARYVRSREILVNDNGQLRS